MEIVLSLLLGIVSLICFLGGMNLLLKGAMKFLPKGIPTQVVASKLKDQQKLWKIYSIILANLFQFRSN